MSKKTKMDRYANAAMGVAIVAVAAIVVSPNVFVTASACAVGTVILLVIDEKIKKLKENK